MNTQFATDVLEGLSKSPKSLSSKYFYDDRGSSLFSKIMQLPEYYLTKAELEIIQTQGLNMIQTLGMAKNQTFEMIELGAGDGFKTIELLKAFKNKKCRFRFIPIDISQKALDQLMNLIENQLPDLDVHPMNGDYFQILHKLSHSSAPKVVLFLGSNIGNMHDSQAKVFLQKLSKNLTTGDKIILGTDLAKSKDIVLPAYNDSQGITKAFNLNLLKRINRELGGDFDISKFEHVPEYNEVEKVAKSALRSKTDQEVTIRDLDQTFEFRAGERINTEISRKYNDEILMEICRDTGLIIRHKFTDSKEYFADYILEKS